MKRLKLVLAAAVAAAVLMTACGGAAESGSSEAASSNEQAEAVAEETTEDAEEATPAEEEEPSVNEAGLADGTYVVDVSTDSNMFHINEADEGTGVLTVENGEMSVHIRMPSKNIVNMYFGTKAEAQAEGAELIEPTTDEVTYSDGMTDEVYGFDVPVPVLGEEFTVAIIGTHGNWYEHKMLVENPVEP